MVPGVLQVSEAVCVVEVSNEVTSLEAKVVGREACEVAVGTGGVLAIRADGFCCYYSANAIGALTIDPEALADDWAPCSAVELEATRRQIFHNLEVWTERRSWVGSEQEFEDEVVTATFSEPLANFCARVSGQIAGQGRLGSNTDLAL